MPQQRRPPNLQTVDRVLTPKLGGQARAVPTG